jgi:hypothetical protein
VDWPECDTTVMSLLPGDGSGDHFGGAPIEVTLSAADTDATISPDFPGTQLVRGEGETLWFLPDPPLDAGTVHGADLAWCGGDIHWQFTTDAEVGAPLDGGVVLTDRAWELELGAARFIEPALAGSFDFGMLGVAGFAVGVSRHDGSALDLRLANLDAKGAQDLCARTPEIPGGTLDRGYVTFGPAEVSFAAYDGEIRIERATLLAGLDRTGVALSDGSFHGWVDVGSVAAVVGVKTEEEGCTFFEAFGATCETCPDSAGQCIELWLDHVGASPVDFALVEVSTVDAGCPE